MSEKKNETNKKEEQQQQQQPPSDTEESSDATYLTALSHVSMVAPSISDTGVPLTPAYSERKSHFQLNVQDEDRPAKQKPDINISDNDITDDDDEEGVDEIERERRVTDFTRDVHEHDRHVSHFAIDTQELESVGANRSKRFTKTKADQHRTSDLSDVSSSDLHLGRSFSRNPRRSGGSLATNLNKGQIFIYVVVPPDGGYGWFIMVISFLCQVIVDGLVFSIGIVMPYIAKDLQVTQAEIVLVVSIQIGCYFLSGPISSAAINRYGFRPVILTGSLISSLSVLISTFSPNLPMLIAFYSIIGGPTLSMIWVTSQLIIGYYFEKYRPIAYGISVSGAGAGIMVASALNSAVVDKIGWRNTLRIHAGLLTTIFLMGMTFVEVAPTRVAHINELDVETETDESEQLIKGNTFRYSRVSSTMFPTAELSAGVSSGGVSGLAITGGTSGLEQMLVEYEKPPRGNCCTRCCGKYRRASKEEGIPRQRLVVRTDFLERQDVYYTGPVDYEQARHRGTVFDGRPIEIDRNRRATQYTLSVIQTGPRAPEERRKTLRELKQTSRRPCLAYIAPTNWMPAKMVKAFKMLFDIRLLTMFEFQILLASAFFFPMGFNIPFVYSKARAEIPIQYANFISPSIGASNFVFRIISGIVAFKFREYTTYVCGFGLMFGGLATFVSAFYGQNVIWFQFTYAVCYGVAPAFYSTLRAIIYVKALGLEKLTNAFGLTGMAMGLGVFMGTTLAGILNEATDSYSASFAFGGCCMIIAGSLKVLLPPFISWKSKRLANSRKVQFS